MSEILYAASTALSFGSGYGWYSEDDTGAVRGFDEASDCGGRTPPLKFVEAIRVERNPHLSPNLRCR